jgi:hypothetical protein
MLCERTEGRWETAPMEKPYGRGVMFQIHVSSIDPIIDRLKDLRVPIYAGPREVWRRYGDREGGRFWPKLTKNKIQFRLTFRENELTLFENSSKRPVLAHITENINQSGIPAARSSVYNSCVRPGAS